MSFISGFAETFVPGLRAMDERAFKEKQTALSMGWEDFTNSRNQAQKKEEEQQKALRQAKSLIEQNGGKGDLSTVYEWMMSGQTMESASKVLASGSWEDTTPAKPITSGKEGTATADSRGLVQTEQAMGGQTPAQPTTPSPQAPKPKAGGIKGMLSNLSGKFNDPQSIQSEAKAQIGQAIGKTPEQMDAATRAQPIELPERRQVFRPNTTQDFLDMTSPGKADYAKAHYQNLIDKGQDTPHNREGLKLASETLASNNERALDLKLAETREINKLAGGGFVDIFDKNDSHLGPIDRDMLEPQRDGTFVVKGRTDPDGNPVIVRGQVRSTELQKRKDAIVDDVKKDMKDVRQKQNNLMSVVGDFGDIWQIVDEDPDVLQSFTSGVATTIDKLIGEAGALKDLAFSMVDKNAGVSEVSASSLNNNLSKAQEAVNGATDAVSRRAANAVLLEAKKNLIAYKYGMAMGQEGRSLSEIERDLFKDMTVQGRNTGAFQRNFSNVVMGMIDQVDNEAESLIRDNESVREFERDFGFSPINIEDRSLTSALKQSDDPRVKFAYDILQTSRQGALGSDAVVRARDNLNVNPSAPRPQQAPAQGMRRVRIPKAAVEQLRANDSPENRKFFMDTFGVDPSSFL